MRVLTFGLSLLLLAGASQTVLAADPDNGETLAKRWCTGCHVVSGDQSKGTDIAPSFSSIATRPNFDEDKLATFLLEPHPKMSNMALSREETKNLASFIALQKRP
ncbi:MAG: cytochrome c [Rhodopseudomonas sp.]|uniref:c-type cytochrome n=1 Tax=Rhodopseudomonas sp. TaxID=1078 RepID=UPI00178DCFB6|nr:c-type cytochrome [Rhodopseudomonas sp.]NVN86825.1 cytochrome c [Rhodopseudomonas sp.]